jgi:predicted N-acetyltransferase YhbS
MIDIVALSSVRAGDIEKLLDDAFGADRFRRTAYLLRKGMPVIQHLSFAAAESGSVIGSIQCWPVQVGQIPLTLVGPVAVTPDRQGQGVGHRLMQAALAAVQPSDAPMMMIGDPEYYGRFGFVSDGTSGWKLPGPWEPRRLLLRNPQGLTLPVADLVGPRTSL